MNPVNTCIIIGGPTAAGKTGLSVQLAQHYGTRILSADSRQCYRELNIGVAKPTPAQLAAVRHYFINSHSITETVSAASYEAYALDALREIFSAHHVAIVVGGTGLYLRALMAGLDAIPAVPPSLREAVQQSYDAHGIDWLREALMQEDPDFFAHGEMKNPQRMMRALEVVRATGKSIRTFQHASGPERNFKTIPLRVTLSREALYQRINQRVDKMMEEGLVEEARSLLPFRHLNALQTVGYQELFAYFDGHGTLDEAVAQIKTHTRNYAKRQETWFRKYLPGPAFEPTQLDEIIRYIHENLK